MGPQLEGRDLLGMAETGSGKTATFVLPILQKIAANPAELPWKGVNTLILAPTRELAIQIDQEVASLSRNMNIRRAVVLGGVSKGPQINALKRGVHVLVATPGRLLDHVNMRSCDLSGVQTLVIDEADRMFDMGFIRDIKKIVSLIPMKRRTALFSATMPTEIRKFAYDILQDPYRVDLSTKTLVVDRIDQKVMIVRSAEKQSRLHTILKDEACSRVIVFTRTKRGADRVAERLAMAGIGAVAFHGNKAQNARQRALNDFTLGHVRVLVATDIAARGIDVSNVTHVVNFDMPLDPETYIHRVGRTARKGNSGIAISLCDHSERQEITAIERLMKQKIDVIDDVGGDLSALPPARPHHETARTSREGNHRGGPRGGAKANGREHGREGGREHSREGGKENNREGGRDGGRERSREGGRERSRDHAAGPRHAERSGEHAGEHRSRDAARPQRDGQKSRVAPQGREEHRANGEGHKPHDGHQHREPRQNRDEHRGERRDDSRGQHRANGEGHTPREGRPARDGQRGRDGHQNREGQQSRDGHRPRGNSRPPRDGEHKPSSHASRPERGGRAAGPHARGNEASANHGSSHASGHASGHTAGQAAAHKRDDAAPSASKNGGERHWNGQRPPKFLSPNGRQARRSPGH